jgi:hypothetical protein
MKKRYMSGLTECVQMKEEDLDWLVYHRILADPDQEPGSLAVAVGCTEEELAASLRRLESSILITKSGVGFRALSLQEFMLACQSRYDSSAPFIVDGGVIREKKGPV